MIDPRTAELLKRYVLAGGAVGAGVGVGTSVANYLSYLKNKSDAQKADNTSGDDDILYVDVPTTKRANVSAWPGVGGGLALAAGTLSMVAANALVKQLYNKVKKKNLQKDLDESQQMYWDSAIKSAAALPDGKPMSSTELVASSPVALTLLAAVASGMITNKALSHYFPARDSGIDPMKESKPKQVKIRYKDMQKVAAEEIPASMDFALASLVDGLDKQASYLPDLVHTAASGGLDTFISNFRDLGLVSALELTKGASSLEVDSDAKYLGICALNRNPETAPVIATLLEAELLDRLPYFHKIAYETEQEDQEVVIKLAAALADDVADSVIDRKTDSDVKENDDNEDSADGKGYKILSNILSQHASDPSKDKKKDDIVDQALAGM